MARSGGGIDPEHGSQLSLFEPTGELATFEREPDARPDFRKGVGRALSAVLAGNSRVAVEELMKLSTEDRYKLRVACRCLQLMSWRMDGS